MTRRHLELALWALAAVAVVAVIARRRRTTPAKAGCKGCGQAKTVGVPVAIGSDSDDGPDPGSWLAGPAGDTGGRTESTIPTGPNPRPVVPPPMPQPAPTPITIAPAARPAPVPVVAAPQNNPGSRGTLG